MERFYIMIVAYNSRRFKVTAISFGDRKEHE